MVKRTKKTVKSVKSKSIMQNVDLTKVAIIVVGLAIVYAVATRVVA